MSILQSKAISNIDSEQKTTAISKAIEKEGEWLLNFNNEVEQWQNRVLSLRQWRKEENWPDVSRIILKG